MAFKHLVGETAILSQKGAFWQTDLYEWDGKLFAQVGGKYIRLKENGSTSKDGINIEMLCLDSPLQKDRFGRLCVSGGKAVAEAAVLKLTHAKARK